MLAPVRLASATRRPLSMLVSATGVTAAFLPSAASGEAALTHCPRSQPRRQQHRSAAAAAAGGRGRRGGDRFDFGRQPPQARAEPMEPSLLTTRKFLQRLEPLQPFRAVGVSFDNRQALIPGLVKNQALAFVRERDNPHDPRAVAIRTLDGQSLGYIARDQTAAFLQDICFGWVASVGRQGEDGLWGLTVAAQPCVQPVEVHAFPSNLAPYVATGMQLASIGGAASDDLRIVLAGRCSVTFSERTTVAERWQFDDATRVLRLAGFRAVAPEVQQIGGLLELDEATAEGPAALLQQLNCWQASDVQLYLSHLRQLRQKRSEQPWRLDLALLAENGLPTPPELRPLCA